MLENKKKGMKPCWSDFTTIVNAAVLGCRIILSEHYMSYGHVNCKTFFLFWMKPEWDKHSVQHHYPASVVCVKTHDCFGKAIPVDLLTC